MTESASPALPFRVTERTRWEDVDLAGIMRYSAYTRLVDVVEAELWRAAGTGVVDLVERLHVWLPRRVLHLEYHAPARFDDLLELRAGITAVGTSSLTLAVEAWSADGRVRHASATMVLVCVTHDTLEKRPLPDELRERVDEFRVTSDE